MNSILKNEINSYINYKRTNNYKYVSEEKLLRSFDKFLLIKNIKEKILDKNILLEFLNKTKCKDRTKARNASVLRQFSIYLNNIYDNKSYVLPIGYFNSKYNFKAHIFTKEERNKIFNSINNGYLKRNLKKQKQVYIITLLLFKTGMRIGEVLTIKRNNIDFNKSSILIENTKNGFDRLIVVNDKMINILKEYDEEYNNDYNYFFENNYKSLYSVGCFGEIFRKILFEAKIMHTENGPRVHDIRHTFCVNSLKQALDRGEDINSFLPILSKYVGHRSIESTLKYLQLTSELFTDIRNVSENIIKLERNIAYEEL